jgi:hypothetical protein
VGDDAPDGTEPPRDPHRVRLARLQEVTSAFSRASTPQEVADVAVRVGASAVDAVASTLWLVDDERDGSAARSVGDERDDAGLHLAAAHGIDAMLEQE